MVFKTVKTVKTQLKIEFLWLYSRHKKVFENVLVNVKCMQIYPTLQQTLTRLLS